MLLQCGFTPSRIAPPAPRLERLSPVGRLRVLTTYQSLGGSSTAPSLRPGAWDLAFDGDLVVELDEELHFNRYRAITLAAEWAAELPWRETYGTLATTHERACLNAGQWGKRWTNPSCERLFGVADPPGNFGPVGAPRWKQRALYDAIKDIAVLDKRDIQLVRLATVDRVGEVFLQDALEGRATLDRDALRDLVEQRRSPR